MYLIKRILVLSAGVLLIISTSCEDKNIDPDPDPDPIPDSTIVVEDTLVPPDGFLMLNVIDKGDSILFVFEDGSSQIISSQRVNNFSIDQVGWEITIDYVDTIDQVIPFFGSEIDLADEHLELNPEGKAPLTAILKFETPYPRMVYVGVKGISANSADISTVFEKPSTWHVLPVYGLYINHNNTIEVKILDALGKPVITRDLHIQTADFNKPQAGFMIVEKNAYTNDQKNRLHFIQNCIYDGAGDIRWYTNEDGHKYYPLSNDLIAIQVFNDKGTPRSGPDIRIIDLFGKTHETYFVPNRVHHEISEKIPGGNLLVGTNAQLYEDRDDDTEDMIIEIDRNTKEVVKSWDLRDIFDKDRPRLWSESVNDWCHLNSIQFDSTDNTLLISSKLQYFISKIDYETGEIKWILGSHKDWEQPWQPYLLTPTNFETESGPDQDFTFAQHMARLTYDGTILVYDNGASRPGDDYTRAVEFSVDSDEMTVTKVWEYIIPYVATFMGSIHLYEDGSVQIGHGAGDRIYEVSREGNILFQAKTKTYYRAYSINLY